MNIANTVASKLFVAFVAASMLVMLATPAKAATAEELQAQIDALMAQISALQGKTSTPSAAYTFTRSLTVGSEGADVKALQDYLTPKYFTNAGGSTGYFGPVTAAAVAAWQTANGVMPAAGYFGPVSQAKYSALMAATPVTPGTDDSDNTDDNTSGDLSGEASLKTTELDSADDDTIEEGAEEVQLGTFNVEFQDGDAKITRIDVKLSATSEEDGWDTFDSVALMVDGDVVKTIDSSDKDNWQDDDETLRLSGLDIVATEDDEMNIDIVGTIANSVDNLPATWSVDVTSLRFVDADDVTSTESVTVDAVTVTLDQAGSDDEVIVKTSSQDPDGTTLEVNDDSKSDWYTTFAFDLDTKDSANDITLNEVPVTVAVGSSLAYNTIVDDAELVIDGTTISDVDVVNGASTTAAAVLTFNVDGDVVIDAGDRVTVELKLRFKSLALANEGVTVTGSVTSDNADAIDAEGADNLGTSQLSGAATGDAMTLRTKGVSAELNDVTSSVTSADGAANDYATYEIKVDVTAFNQDVYLSKNTATSAVYTLTDGAGASVAAGTRTVVFSSSKESNDDTTGYFKIPEGETETLTLKVTYLPGAAGVSARLNLTSFKYDETGTVTPAQTWNASPANDYQTDVETIVN